MLPLLAISIQIVHYGLALVDLAICVAMVLMFLVSIKEQNEEMLRLERAGRIWRKSWTSPRC